MDVVHTGTNLVGVTVLLEGVEELHVTLGCLDGDNISVKTLNGGEDIVKVRVTEVRVCLELVGNTGSGKLERINSPLEVCVPISATEGELLRCKISDNYMQSYDIIVLTPSRIAGSSTWIALMPAFSRSMTSSRRANASCLDCNSRLTSARGNDQLRMVTGPVSIPFMGFVVRL